MKLHEIDLSADSIRDFCAKWKIKELSVFGSILRDDFGPNSDVDFLATFHDSAEWGIFELLEMEQELGKMLGRKVDIVERCGVEKSPNYIRRRHILSTAEPIYAQG